MILIKTKRVGGGGESMTAQRCLIYLSLLFILVFHISKIEAEETTQWKLPDGAKARLGNGVMTDMQLSTDASKLAIASSTGVRLYDVDTGAESVLLTKDADLVGSITFSPNGNRLAYASGEKKCYIWNLLNNEILTTFNTKDTSYKSLKILKDGKTLVARTWKDTFLLWDITNGELLDSFSPKASKIRIKGMDWHRAKDGVVDDSGSVTYAIANHDGTVSIQDGQTHQLIRTLVPQTNVAAFLKVGQEQELIVIRAMPPELIIEDEEKQIPSNFRDDGKPFPIQYKLNPQNRFTATLEKQPIKWISELKFSPDGKLLVSKSNYKIPRWRGASGTLGPTELWDVESGEQLAALPWWVDVRFSSDSNTIALFSHRGFSQGRCDIWDMIDRHQIAEFESTAEVKFSGDGKTLYIRRGKSIDNSGIVVERPRYTIWDISTKSEMASVHPIGGQDVLLPNKQLLSNDGSVLVTANENSTIDVWKTKTDTQIRTLAAGYTGKFTSLAFSDDSKTLASGSPGRIQLWDTESGSLRNTITTEKVDIEGITFDKDNKQLTTIGFGSTIQWDVSTGEQITSDNTRINLDASLGSFHFDDGSWIAVSVYSISPNFKTIAAKNRKVDGIEIWQTDTRKRIGLLKDDAFKSARGAMTLNPDGSIFATVNLFGKDHEVYLWDTDTGERIATLNITKNFIERVFASFMDIRTYALMFDFRGETLAVGTAKKDIQLWDVDIQKRVKNIKTRHKYAICKLAFSPDGNFLASGDTGGVIHVWDTKTGKHVAEYKGHKGNINVMVFAENSKYIASTGLYDGVIVLWEVPQ